MSNRYIEGLQTKSNRDTTQQNTETLSHKEYSPFSSHLSLQPHTHHQHTFSNSFKKVPYPVDFTKFNIFCPICGKHVSDKAQYKAYQSTKLGKTFLAHGLCLQKDSELNFNFAPENLNEAKIQQIGFIGKDRSISLGGKQFYVQLVISHVLSEHQFLKMNTKLKSIGRIIRWELKNLQETEWFYPNIIGFPILDFKITVTLTQMSSKDHKMQFRSYVNLGRMDLHQLKMIKASSDEIQLTLRIIHSQDEKHETIEAMNYKYKYPLFSSLPIVEFNSILIKLPQESQDDINLVNDSQPSSLTQLIQRTESQVSTHKSSSVCFRKEYGYGHDTISNYSITSHQKDKVDLQRLIANKLLGEYVRSNIQSRIFQNFLMNQATPEQVQEILKALYFQLPDLIMHQYANYMVQKLFRVCNMAQRIHIIQRLFAQIPTIARNKQGTHTIQTLVGLFTNDQEYKLVCESITNSFYQLSTHPNATHFIQKIILTFPIANTLDFFHFVNENFITFAVQKNGMCVMKNMFKKIKQIIDAGHKSVPLITQIKKHFINSVTFNIDKIIQDSYGNYIVQFCYELFGELKCSGITEMIIERFPQFSIQKYSSSVVLKCIGVYWTNKDILNRLKTSLTCQAIDEMYKNRDGNKILLQIMEKYEHSVLRQKIYNQLILGQPTKFNHDRWGVALGSRSGTVGTQFSSFSDALKKSPNKNKKRGNH